jgi:hypothetical protein
MALEPTDLHAMKQVVVDAVEPRIAGLEKRLEEQLADFRGEARVLFQQQGETLAKAISDAVKVIADNHPTREEFQELQNEVGELRQKVHALLGHS